MSILEYTALELAAQIRKKEISCREAVEAVFGQIEKQEEGLNCYISLDRGGRPSPGGRGAEEDRGRNACRPACRCSGGGEGQHLHSGEGGPPARRGSFRILSRPVTPLR